MKKTLLTFCLFFLLAMAYGQHSASGLDQGTTTIKLFPNPATNVLNVLGLENSEKAAIFITDVYGNIVQQHQWRITKNALNIPVTNLSSGMYVLRIRSTRQEVTRKFYKS